MQYRLGAGMQDTAVAETSGEQRRIRCILHQGRAVKARLHPVSCIRSHPFVALPVKNIFQKAEPCYPRNNIRLPARLILSSSTQRS